MSNHRTQAGPLSPGIQHWRMKRLGAFLRGDLINFLRTEESESPPAEREASGYPLEGGIF
jgi:hypothetical protein